MGSKRDRNKLQEGDIVEVVGQTGLHRFGQSRGGVMGKRDPLEPGDIVEIVPGPIHYGHGYKPGMLCYVQTRRDTTDYELEPVDPKNPRIPRWQIVHTEDFKPIWTKARGYHEKA